MELNSLLLRKALRRNLRKIPNDIIPHIFERIENLVKEPVSPDSYKLAGSDNLYRHSHWYG